MIYNEEALSKLLECGMITHVFTMSDKKMQELHDWLEIGRVQLKFSSLQLSIKDDFLKLNSYWYWHNGERCITKTRYVEKEQDAVEVLKDLMIESKEERDGIIEFDNLDKTEVQIKCY